MRMFQRVLGGLAILCFAHPSTVSAQSESAPAASAPADVTAALEAVLDCEAAEHVAWLYGFRQLDERYTMGTERQREGAHARVADAMDACTDALGLLSAEDAAPFQTDVVAPWVALEAICFEATISDVLSQMQNVSSSMVLQDLLGRIDEGSATTNEALRTTARRRLTSRHLRTALLTLQANINTANSERAAWQYDATDLTGAERREALATVASLARTMTMLRRNRSAAVAALERWRRGAARDGLLRVFARSFEGHLSE